MFKYRDVEEKVIKELAGEAVMRRINHTEVMKVVNSQAAKLRETKKEKTKTGGNAAKPTDNSKYLPNFKKTLK